MQHMHGMFTQLFDCWADSVVHLLLVKSSMGKVTWLELNQLFAILCSHKIQFLCQLNFDCKFDHKLQKFRNLRPFYHKLRRKKFYGTGPTHCNGSICCLNGMDSAVSVPTNKNIFSCLVKSDAVELMTSHTVFLLPTMSVQWLRLWAC